MAKKSAEVDVEQVIENARRAGLSSAVLDGVAMELATDGKSDTLAAYGLDSKTGANAETGEVVDLSGTGDAGGDVQVG